MNAAGNKEWRAGRYVRELVTTVKGKVTIDWTLRETVRAELRVISRPRPPRP